MTVSKELDHVTAPCDLRNFRYVSLAGAGVLLQHLTDAMMQDGSSHILYHVLYSYNGYNITIYDLIPNTIHIMY